MSGSNEQQLEGSNGQQLEGADLGVPVYDPRDPRAWEADGPQQPGAMLPVPGPWGLGYQGLPAVRPGAPPRAPLVIMPVPGQMHRAPLQPIGPYRDATNGGALGQLVA
jgi:hypothetical protein